MPELPEVETVKTQLSKAGLVHAKIVSAHILFPKLLKTHSPESFYKLIEGGEILNIRRRGKHLILDLQDHALIIHLRMSGQFFITQALPSNMNYIRAYLKLSCGYLLFHDVRKFGTWHMVKDANRHLAHLGVEPLSCDLTENFLIQSLKKTSKAIKPKLLDQNFIAGIGNIYADEFLWLAAISPQRPSQSLSQTEIQKLKTAISQTLKKAIAENGSSLGNSKGNFKTTEGISGKYQYNFKVYGQAKRACPRCQTPISKIKFFGRSAHYCPNCQK